MVDVEEMKERYPRAYVGVRGLWIIILSTILSLILVAPIYFFQIETQVIVDFFTFPPDIIPQPYNLIGIPLIPIGMLLIIWANFALLYRGRISLREREPMQRPSTLVLSGPYRFSRNPLYLGGLLAILGLAIILSSLLTTIFLVLAYYVIRYIFIKREEIILEEEFGEEYLEFKKRVRRWI